MSHLLFVETTGLGVQALAHAKRNGHTVTCLHCPLHDFTATPAQRREAIELADHSAPFADALDSDAVYGALLASGADPGAVDAVLSTLSYGAQAAADLAARIGARGTSPAGTLAARDKGESRRVLRERGVPSVDFRVVTDAAEAPEAAEAIGYPVIVKPVLGIGKAVTSIARDASAVRAHFAPPRTVTGSGHARTGAGDVVPPMRTNFDSFGMLRALAPTPAEAEAACSAVKADVEVLLGFPLLAERTRTPAPAA
ncbi:hypothetical protein [Streptomyces sp.]|uniref:ATP-binding protein n=1 Tax=Streptomyces sp. TaxID=1931 RepID=UPI0028111304|nr:hypothetical protein [Streptomyces sp.]